MHEERLNELLRQVRDGAVSVDEALASLKNLPFERMGFANIDHHRALRCGIPEVIYCPGKSTAQVVDIFERMALTGNDVLATRATEEVYQAVAARSPQAQWEAAARAIILKQQHGPRSAGYIAVVSAGTSDIPVAEEARVTAELLDQQVRTIYDVGVAGLHRVLSHREEIVAADVIVVVAGMEGALASVVGGLARTPVIAVPTSVGYGASFGGLAPLLTMLNSCVPGVAVVNIDNGFSAGVLAAMISRRCAPPASEAK